MVMALVGSVPGISYQWIECARCKMPYAKGRDCKCYAVNYTFGYKLGEDKSPEQLQREELERQQRHQQRQQMQQQQQHFQQQQQQRPIEL